MGAARPFQRVEGAFSMAALIKQWSGKASCGELGNREETVPGGNAISVRAGSGLVA